MIYYKFSDYLKNKYGSKIYKLPVNIPVTCPNRDGKFGNEGCIFCGEEGAGFEMLPNTMSVKEQLNSNKKYIGSKYNSEKFIVYFQNYSNTYLELEKFKEYIIDACVDSIVAIYISTRPDCVQDVQLEFLKEIKSQYNIDIVLELGLQTINHKTLKFIKRGHTLAEFIDAVIRIKKYGLETCVHYIVDLPMDTIEDTIEGAKILSSLGVEQIKCHSLFILKGTHLGKLYEENKFQPVTYEEFEERIISFLEYLNPKIAIQRIVGRAPKDRTLFCNWDTSWWKIKAQIEDKMKNENRIQGNLYNYLGGKYRL